MNGNKPTQGYRSYGSLIFAMSSNKPELNSIAYTEQTQGQDKAVHVTRKTLFCFKRIFFRIPIVKYLYLPKILTILLFHVKDSN